MKKLYSIRHFVLLLLIIILSIRFHTVINSLVLLFYFIKLLFTDPVLAYGRISFDLFDCFFSAAGVVAIIVGLIINECIPRSVNFLDRKITFTSSAVIILLVCYFFAPLVAESNPEFQKNINVTKLLSPFSSVTEIISNQNLEENKGDVFLNLQNRVIKRSFDNNITFADSVKGGEQVMYYQKGVGHILPVKKSEDQTISEVGDYKINSKMFILGTDEFGRDIFSRLIYGCRVSLTIGLLSVLITFILGSLLGFFAGYTGGLVDSFLNRMSDMFLSFPIIFLIILILALFGNSILSVIVVLGFSGWMSLFKIVRSEIISLKRRDYFLSAKLMGTGNIKLIVYEMLPVIAAPVIVNLVFQFGNVILAESALSYLGLGTGGSVPSWGSMIEAGQGYIYRAWWMIMFPGFALFLSLLIINNIGYRVKIILNH